MFDLTEHQKMIRDEVRAFARGDLLPKAAERDEKHIFPAAEFKRLAELGIMAMNVPEALGGSEVGVVAYALAVMELAYVDASVTVGMAVTNMVCEIVTKYARPEIAKRFVPAVASGELLCGSFALSEAGSGSDAGAMQTRAQLVGDKWVLNGTKLWITSADHAGLFVVWARTETDVKGAKGVSAFLVPGGTPGMQVGRAERKMGLHGSTTCELLFEDCAIPAEYLLYERGKGFSVAMTALDGGRIGVGSQGWGIGAAALDAAKSYIKQRKQFGKTLAEFQINQFKVADLATQRDAAWLLLMRAAHLKETDRPFTREASMAKVYATEWANRCCGEALQMHGGVGYTMDYPVERYLRDARVTTIYEGTSEVQRIVISREELAD